MQLKDGGKRALKYRDFSFEVKDVSAKGRFTGYASVFGVMDTYREIVASGAFQESIDQIKNSGRPLPALWQHRAAEPIGGYDLLQEDAKGLYVEGNLLIDDVPEAKKAHALMKARIVSGLSIGYYVLDEAWNEKERILTLKKLELVEVSVVTFPANPEARIDAIKSKLAHGTMPTEREFEAILREQGFSRNQAAVIANRGFKHLLDQGEPGGDVSEMVSALRSVSITW